MGKNRTEPTLHIAPQRRLNIIYFIDSAKTRSITIPLGRLNIIILSILLVLIWNVVSVFVISWLGTQQRELSLRLKSSLATIFEYQARFDNVYEIAYPPTLQLPDSTYDPLTAGIRSEEYKELSTPNQNSPLPQREEPPQSATPPNSKVEDPVPPEPKQDSEQASPRSERAETKEDAVSKGGTDSSNEKNQPIEEEFVSVGNISLERSNIGANLNLELTNRTPSTRVEGYIWGIAEFTSDEGIKHLISAPKEIKINANGEPKNPEKATYFGIKRFKKQTFNFQIAKGRVGTITNIRIGVMSLSGERKKLFRIQTDFRLR